jgi:glycine cleavage system regulatory protein
MKYTEISDKEQIKKEFSKLLIEHGYTMRSFCIKFGYIPITTYQMMSANARYHVDHEKVNEMISKLDPKKSLQRIGGKMLIARTF